jgi:hypothetical protein
VRRAALLGWLVALCVPCAARAAADPDIALAALITDEHLGEISGLAASRRHPGIFWVHNDGDNAAELYAIDAQGERRATLRIEGVRNVDWEDIAAFTWEGKHYLLVADIGDNGGLRTQLALRAIQEPDTLADTSTRPAWTQAFRWPDGARDCEAMAVDEREGAVYLVSKKRVPPELFRVPLRPGAGVQVAQRLGTLGGIEQPTDADLRRNPVYGRYRAQITAADISPDGSRFAVLNYRRVYLWSRSPRGWGDAVSHTARVIEFPWTPQAEALGFDLSGKSLWISSERLPAPLLRLPLERGAATVGHTGD